MARPLRIEFPDACYLVTSRGNAGQRVFENSDDGRLWRETFESVCSRFGWIPHAYCMMGNHYHIVIETPRPNLSKGMRQLNGVYTQSFNRKHNRAGHLFMGRFQAIIFNKDTYLKPLVRHVVTSPVREGLVSSPVQWRWSSCRASCGKEISELVDPQTVVSAFGSFSGFEKYVNEENPPDPTAEIRRQIFLGDDEFVRKTAALAGAVSPEVPGKQTAVVKMRTRFAEVGERNRAIFAAYRSGSLTMKQISEQFGVHYSTVSRIVSESEKEEFKQTG